MTQKISDLTKAEAATKTATAPPSPVEVARHGSPAAATENEIALVREYLEAHRVMEEKKALKETIKNILGEEMIKRHVKTLTYNSRNLVTLSPMTSTTRDWPGLEEDHPEIAAQYTTSTPTTRMDFKKNILPPVIASE